MYNCLVLLRLRDRSKRNIGLIGSTPENITGLTGQYMLIARITDDILSDQSGDKFEHVTSEISQQIDHPGKENE